VMDQAYPNWQLCLADDASERAETLAKLTSLVERDSRVSLTRLPRRSGISAATNAALSLATGEYVAFLDHDDVLKPHALAQVVRWLDADPPWTCFIATRTSWTRPAGSPRPAGNPTSRPTCCCARTTSAISSPSGVR